MKAIGLNTFQLKWIAIIAMVVDHTGVMLFPQYIIFRYIGRIAFPIFCFLLVEGVFHTRNRKKYLIRLGIFVGISEIPFDLALTGKLLSMDHQNVFVTLFLGVLMLFLIQRYKNVAVQVLVIFLVMAITELTRSDYGAKGILLIAGFYMLRNQKIWKICFGAIWNIITSNYWKIQGFGALALIPIALYNGEKGPGMKYIFYLFYPIHLLILYVIQLYAFA